MSDSPPTPGHPPAGSPPPPPPPPGSATPPPPPAAPSAPPAPAPASTPPPPPARPASATPPPPPARPASATPPPPPARPASATPPPPPPPSATTAGPPAVSASGPVSPATDDDLAALLSELTDDGASAAPSVGAPLTKPTDVERPEQAAAVSIESAGGLDFDPELASYGARLGGLAIDSAVVLVAALPGFALVVAGSGPWRFLGALLMVAGFAVTTTLYARAVSSSGQWIGNRITDTKVVDARHGRTVSTAEAGTRFVVRFLVSSVLLVGFLVALGNSQRRTFHDNIAGTVVTRPPRARWSIDDEDFGG